MGPAWKIGIVCVLLQQVLTTLAISDEARLVKRLQEKYNEEYKSTRPVDKSSDSLTVSMGYDLIELTHVDLGTGMATFLFYEKQTWIDTHLKWNPSEYGGLTAVRLPTKNIWLPDIVNYGSNMANPDRFVAPALVYSNGMVLWIPKSVEKMRCNTVDPEMGDLECSFKVGSWTYDGSLIDIQLYDNVTSMGTDSFQGKKIWEVKKNVAERGEGKYDCCDELYPYVRFNITFAHIGPEGSVSGSSSLHVSVLVTVTIALLACILRL
jgi:hypothetical protein